METYNIHLIATDKPTKIGIRDSTNKLELRNEDYKGTFITPQHLYITSSEEIKEGDWFLNSKLKTISKANNWIYVTNCLKIVATDNTELWATKIQKEEEALYRSANNHIYVPTDIAMIPQSLIELYVREWNTGKPMKEVKLEEIIDENDKRNWHEDVPTGKYWEDIPTPPSKDRLYTDAKYKRLKLTSDGYIIPLPIKEKMYNREEVKALHKQWVKESGMPRESGSCYFEEWFDKNYP